MASRWKTMRPPMVPGTIVRRDFEPWEQNDGTLMTFGVVLHDMGRQGPIVVLWSNPNGPMLTSDDYSRCLPKVIKVSA